MVDASSERIGFIGLGDMGGPMAENLARSGAQPTVFDIRAASLGRAVELGARRAASVREIAEQSDIVFVCMRDREHFDAVVLGQHGLLASWDHALRARTHTGPEPLVVVHSTFSPQVVQAVGVAAAEVSVRVLDAPVSGGRRGSVAGTLTLMIGGDQFDFERCRPFFDVVADNVFFIGNQLGQGQVAKLCNNTMSLCNLFATIEAAKLAQAYGISEQLLVAVAQVSTGDSWYVRNWDFLESTMSSHTSTDISSIQARFTKDLLAAVDVAATRGITLTYAARAAATGRSLLVERRAQFDALTAVDDHLAEPVSHRRPHA